MEPRYQPDKTKTQHVMDDDFFDDDFDDDFEPKKSFSDILFEMERSGTILRQWESGAPNENAPQQNQKHEL